MYKLIDQRLIEAAAEGIRNGRLVVFPTDTVYGLGANATDPSAVARIFEMKKRPLFDPLIVHFYDPEMIDSYADTSDKRANLLMEKFWPGPLTLVLEKLSTIPDIVTSGLSTVGVRIPNHPVALELIRLSGCPISAPSANLFQRLSPTTHGHVMEQISNADFYLDGGPTKIGLESTVVKLVENGFLILRPGIITSEIISDTISCDEIINSDVHINAPGMLKSHYRPQKPLYFTNDPAAAILDRAKSGIICYSDHEYKGYAAVYRLSNDDDFRVYATNMFRILHELENSPIECIVVEPVPLRGIGIAIMDRYSKAHC